MPAFLRRARRVEEEIDKMAFSARDDFSEPMRKLSEAFRSAGITMGTVPQRPPPRPREVRCPYCDSAVHGDRCGNCGAPHTIEGRPS